MAAEFGHADGLSHDLRLAGWALEKSRTNGNLFYWNAKSGQRYWRWRDGWGWTTATDPKTRKRFKLYCHILTGKKLKHAPGAAAAPSSWKDASAPKPKKLKKQPAAPRTSLVHEDKKNPQPSTAAELKGVDTVAAREPLSSFKEASQAGDPSDVSDEEDVNAEPPKRPSWHNVDLSPVKITDPALLAAIDWRRAPQMWRKQKNSPHVMQAFNNNTVVYKSLSDLPFTRVLAPDCPQEPYRRRKNEEKTVVNWTDRSLFLTELEFLIRFDKPTTEALVIVFAGMGNSTCHVATLAEWFPRAQFHIFPDKGEEYPRARARIEKKHKHHVKWYDHPFDPKPSLLQSEDFYGRFVVLISNPKTYIETTDKAELMARQLAWYRALQPKAAMLKFDLPWPENKHDTASATEFPCGEIRFPVFATPTGTECRLVTAGSKFSLNEKDAGFQKERSATQMYNHRKYEGQMFHYNTCRRVSVYDHPVNGEGIDHCYDCTCEANILLDFARRRHSKKSREVQISTVQLLTQKLSRDLADPRRPRTLNGFAGGARRKAAFNKSNSSK